MKLKGLLILLLISFIIFIIYRFNIDNKIYYINITDSDITYNKEIKNYLNKNKKLEKYINYKDLNYRITDLINEINDNKEIRINGKKQTLQNSLIKADLLTVKIGSNEIKYKIKDKDLAGLYNYIDEYLNDLDKLFKLLRKYDKETIIYINTVNNQNEYIDEIIEYLNLKVEELCNDYKIEYMELNNQNDIKIKEKVLKYLQLTI
ncbi:MAG: hypothetical protein IJ715_02735 [Bacilli bacterium]|nr:hypothetical protein [Bacilli bacterium]